MASKKKWEDLDISNDEAKRLCDAFKNEEFRKMFIEYAEELQDPENKKRYEEELKTLEAQRGMDVQFIHPEPGYVIKTSVDGSTKAFINICKNEHVGKPEMKKDVNPKTGRLEPSWYLPHSLAPVRDDLDKAGNKCRVFDVVFHPDAYRMGESNSRFRLMLEDTAISSAERQFTVKFDRKNIKRPNMKFKGTPQATVLRKRKDDSSSGDRKSEEESKDDVLAGLKYPYDNKTSEEKARENEEKARQREEAATKKDMSGKEPQQNDSSEVPKYSILHRQEIDFQDYRDSPDTRQSTRPKELIITIDLPLLKSASSANLDIFEKRLLLESTTPAKYKLDLPLPYPVDEDNGSAKFDKSKRRLTVTLPVLKADIPEIVPTTTSKSDNHDQIESPVVEERQQNGSCEENENIPDLEDDIPDLEDDTPDHEDDIREPQSRPLIEVLSNSEATSNKEQKPATQEQVANRASDKDIWTGDDVDQHLLKQNIMYSLPPYSANQDWETTTFILDCKNVQRESLSKTFANNCVQLRFITMGTGGFPMHYSFVVSFEDDCAVDTTACDVSVSDENIVMILGKTSEAAGIWDKFLVGTDQTKLEEALFVTEKTLSSALDQLDANCTMPVNNNDKMPELEVTDMNDDQLTIQLSNVSPSVVDKPQRLKKFSESSDDIEVVHSLGSLPALHGILKDRSRTVSESSDEVFSSSGGSHHYRREDSISSILSTGSASEGLVSESEEGGTTPSRKKSVSFSEFVDRTTYKSTASVSALHATLKKRNKRCRKKEARIERRRRRSSGSEHEQSSEEQSSSQVDSQDTAGDDDDDEVVIVQTSAEAGASAAPTIVVEPKVAQAATATPADEDEENVIAAKQPSKKCKKSKKKNKNKHHGESAGVSEKTAASHTPRETSSGTDEGAGAAECVTPEDGERTSTSAVEAPASSPLNDKSSSGDNVAHVNGTGPAMAAASVTAATAASAATAVGSDDSDDGEGPSPRPPTIPAAKDEPDKERTKSDTVLSWANGQKDQEDVTKCAFSFSNAMMYDLDDD